MKKLRQFFLKGGGVAGAQHPTPHLQTQALWGLFCWCCCCSCCCCWLLLLLLLLLFLFVKAGGLGRQPHPFANPMNVWWWGVFILRLQYCGWGCFCFAVWAPTGRSLTCGFCWGFSCRAVGGGGGGCFFNCCSLFSLAAAGAVCVCVCVFFFRAVAAPHRPFRIAGASAAEQLLGEGRRFFFFFFLGEGLFLFFVLFGPPRHFTHLLVCRASAAEHNNKKAATANGNTRSNKGSVTLNITSLTNTSMGERSERSQLLNLTMKINEIPAVVLQSLEQLKPGSWSFLVMSSHTFYIRQTATGVLISSSCSPSFASVPPSMMHFRML